MPNPQTIAQLIAVVSADTSKFEDRMNRVEDQLKKQKEEFDRTVESYQSGVNKMTAATDKFIDTKKKGEANLAEYEYRTNQTSAEEYIEFLQKRMSAFQNYTTEWRSAALRSVAVENEMNARATANYKAELQTRINLTKEALIQSGASRGQLLTFDRGNITAQLSGATSVEEQAALSAKLVQIAKEEKAALLAEEREFNAEAEALVRDRYAQQIALGREYNAWIKESNAAAAASTEEYLAEQTAMQEAAAAKSAKIWTAVGGTIGNLSAIITGVGAASAILSSGIDHNIQGLANNTLMAQGDLANMKKDVLDLASQTGQEFDDIAKGYMYVADFGFKGADATKVLTIANKEATATMSSTESVAKTLATSLSIFGADANQAAGYMDVLHHAAADGAVSVQQFSDAAGPALAIAAAFKIKFYDAASAMSALTKAGFNASEAATQIRGIVSHIGDPADKVTKTLIDLKAITGVDLVSDFSQAGLAAKGLTGVLDDLFKATGGNAELIAKIIPALRGGIGTMALDSGKISRDMHQTLAETKALQEANTGVETNTVFDRMQKDSLQQWKEFIKTLEVDFIPVGERAMKVFMDFEPAIKKGAEALLDLMHGFQELPEPIQQAIYLIGGLMILEKFTGILTMLQIPTGFSYAIKQLVGDLPALNAGIVLTGEGASSAAITLGAYALVIGGVAIALAGLGYELYSLAKLWGDTNAEEQKALDNANRFENMRKDFLQSSGERANLTLRNTSYGDQISDLQDQIKQTQINLPNYTYGGTIYKEAQQLIIDDKNKIIELQQKQKQNEIDIAEATRKAAGEHANLLHNQSAVDIYRRSLPADKTPAQVAAEHTTTLEKLRAYQEQRKEEEKAAKAAAAAAKELEKRYGKEISLLHEVIDLGKKKEDLDSNDQLNKAVQATGPGGVYAGISSLEKSKYITLAKLADHAEHQNYINGVMNSVSNKQELQKMPYEQQEAIDKFLGGDLDKWKALGTTFSGVQKQMVDAVVRGNVAEEIYKEKKALDDLAFSIAIAGDAVKKAAVDQAGGRQGWQSLPGETQQSALRTQQYLMYVDSLTKMVEDYKSKAAPIPELHTVSEEANKGIADLITKLGYVIPLTKEYFDILKLIAQVKVAAAQADDRNYQNWVSTTQEEINLQKQKNQEGAPSFFTGAVNVRQRAIDQFNITNRKEIDRANSIFGPNQIGDLQNQAGDNAVSADANAQVQIFNTSLENGVKKFDELKESIRGMYAKGMSAVQKWEDENRKAIEQLKEDLGTAADPIIAAYEKIVKEQAVAIRKLQQLADVVNMEQAGVGALSGGIFAGVNAAFSPSGQQRGSLQTQLLSQQNQMLQYQIGQAEFKSKYPGDPNNPFAPLMNNLQSQINSTNSQISKMGNNFNAVITRLADSFYNSFQQSILKIAQDYLQKQLTNYLSSQILGSGAQLGGFAGGNGSISSPMSGLGWVEQALAAGVGIYGSFTKANASAGVSGANTGASVGIQDFNPDPQGGQIIPDIPSPGNKAENIRTITSNGQASGGGTMVANVTYNITTPDVQGFRRSKKSVVQDARKAFR